MVRGGEAGSPGGPGGRPTASGKTNPSPGRGGPGAVPPQVAKPTPAPVGGVRGAVPPQVAKPTPAPVGGSGGSSHRKWQNQPQPQSGGSGGASHRKLQNQPQPRSWGSGGSSPRIDTAAPRRSWRIQQAWEGGPDTLRTGVRPVGNELAELRCLLGARALPGSNPPPAGPDRCPFPVLRLALRRGHAESPAARSLAWVASIVPASQPGAGLRSNLPLISAMSTPVMMIDSPGDSPSPGDTIDPPRRVRQSALFIRPERRFQREDRR